MYRGFEDRPFYTAVEQGHKYNPKKELRLIILDAITLDCRNGTIDPISKAFLKMAGVFSELDLYVTSTRVKNGIATPRRMAVRLAESAQQ